MSFLNYFRILLYLSLIAGSIIPRSVSAQETTAYTYDALGRLVAVRTEGNPDQQRTATYDYDQAGNRTVVRTTGGSSGGGGNSDGAVVGSRQRLVVTPIGAYVPVFYRE
jgi:YD repeat-containing protein